MKIKILASAAILACLSGMAQADISYNYVQATYQMETDNDIFLWEVKGSYQVNDQLYVTMDDQNIRSAAGAGELDRLKEGVARSLLFQWSIRMEASIHEARATSAALPAGRAGTAHLRRDARVPSR